MKNNGHGENLLFILCKILHNLHNLHNFFSLLLLELVTVCASRLNGEHIMSTAQPMRLRLDSFVKQKSPARIPEPTAIKAQVL
jgi:hypothetical protein